MEDVFLTRAEVEKRTGLARSSIYRLMRRGGFPEPHRIGERAVRWSRQELEKMARQTAAGDRPGCGRCR